MLHSHHGEQDGRLREAHAGREVAGEESRSQARQEVQDQVVVHKIVAIRLRSAMRSVNTWSRGLHCVAVGPERRQQGMA